MYGSRGRRHESTGRSASLPVLPVFCQNWQTDNYGGSPSVDGGSADGDSTNGGSADGGVDGGVGGGSVDGGADGGSPDGVPRLVLPVESLATQVEDVFKPTAFEKPQEDWNLNEHGFTIIDEVLPDLTMKESDHWRPISTHRCGTWMRFETLTN